MLSCNLDIISIPGDVVQSEVVDDDETVTQHFCEDTVHRFTCSCLRVVYFPPLFFKSYSTLFYTSPISEMEDMALGKAVTSESLDLEDILTVFLLMISM